MTVAPLRIGIAGLGTVGLGTVILLEENADIIALRAGRPVEITAVSARSKTTRARDISKYRWYDNALEMVNDSEVDVIVELIGGSEGIAHTLCKAAILAGKPVVTANKALIAHHGCDLAKLAEQRKVALAFEAAVAGGIPIIHALRTGLAANKFSRIEGILNGTCNYILTTMREAVAAKAEGADFAEVLADAQKLGYAEADPSFDVDGIDAAHKLAIITSLAYGCPVNLSAVQIEGIRSITASDMRYAAELGYVIKLLGITERTPEGISQRVHPCFVPRKAPIAKVDGVYNAVVAHGDACGTMVFEGRGAGAGPTASSIVSDLIDIARGAGQTPFLLPVAKFTQEKLADPALLKSCYYIRLSVVDKPGVLADVTGIFRDHGISMRTFVQHSRTPGEAVELALTTHEAQHAAMEKAIAAIGKLEAVVTPPQRIRILT
ncbi:MAG: homoserine dehydrogenase [Alphaproteobacteria bacterium]|nr:homoserine dehydrogenase [Alphaproteobacteria bacterium]